MPNLLSEEDKVNKQWRIAFIVRDLREIEKALKELKVKLAKPSN